MLKNCENCGGSGNILTDCSICMYHPHLHEKGKSNQWVSIEEAEAKGYGRRSFEEMLKMLSETVINK